MIEDLQVSENITSSRSVELTWRLPSTTNTDLEMLLYRETFIYSITVRLPEKKITLKVLYLEIKYLI